MAVPQVVKVQQGGYSVAKDIKNTGETIKVQQGGYSVAQGSQQSQSSSNQVYDSAGRILPSAIKNDPNIQGDMVYIQKGNSRILKSYYSKDAQDYLIQKYSQQKATQPVAQPTPTVKVQQGGYSVAQTKQPTVTPQYPTIVTGSSIKSTAQTQPVQQPTIIKKVEQPTVTPAKTPTIQTQRVGVASAGANKPIPTAQTLKGSYYDASKTNVPSVVNPSYVPTYTKEQQATGKVTPNKQIEYPFMSLKQYNNDVHIQPKNTLPNTQLYPTYNTGKTSMETVKIAIKEKNVLDRINTGVAKTFNPAYNEIVSNEGLNKYNDAYKKTIGKAVPLGTVITPKFAANAAVGSAEGVISFIPSTITLGKGLVTEPVTTIKDTAKGTVELAKTNPGRLTGNIVGSAVAGGAIAKATPKINPSAIKENIPYRVVRSSEESNFILRVPEVTAYEAPNPVPSLSPRVTTPQPIEIKSFSGKVKQGKADAYFKITESEAMKVMDRVNVRIENIRTDYGSFVELTPVSLKEPVAGIKKGAKQITTTERTMIGKQKVTPNPKTIKSPIRIEKYKKLEPAYFQDIKVPNRLQIPDFTYDMEIRPTVDSTALVRTDKFTYDRPNPTVKTPPQEITGYPIKQIKETNPKRVPSKAEYDAWVDNLGKPTYKPPSITEIKIKNDIIKENVVRDVEYTPQPEPVMVMEKRTPTKTATKFKDNVQIDINMDYIFEPQPELAPTISTKKTVLKYKEPIKDKSFNEEFKRLYNGLPPKSVSRMGTFGNVKGKASPNINPVALPRKPPMPTSDGGGNGAFGSGGKKTGMGDTGYNPFITSYPKYPWKITNPGWNMPRQSEPSPIYGNIPQPQPTSKSGGSPRPADNLPGYNPVPVIYPQPEIPPTPQPYPIGSGQLPPLPPKSKTDYPKFNPYMFSYPMPKRKKETTTEQFKIPKNKKFQWFIKNPLNEVIDYKKLKRLQNDKGPW